MNEINYRVPATGKRKRFIKVDGKWFRSVSGHSAGRPLPECALTVALEKLLKETQAQEWARSSGKSVTLGHCTMQRHPQVRHSPDGVDIIIECPKCCMAWLVKGITGEQIRLAGSSYEKRLVEQKFLES